MEDKNQTGAATGASTGDVSESTVASTTSTEVASSVATPAVSVSTPDSSVVTSTADVATAEPAPVTTSEPAPVSSEAPVSMPEATSSVTPDITTDTTSSTRAVVIKQYAIAFAVILIMASGVTYTLIQQGRIKTPAFVAKIVELVHPAPAAAVVNGVKIPMADYLKNKSQIEHSATQSGADLSNASIQSQIKSQALDVLVNTEILRQAAIKDGVKVTDDQVKARYDEIVKTLQGEDKLAAKMTELGMTKESLLKDIASEILIQSYLAKSVDTSSVKISDEDIKAAYDQANSNPDAKLPPLDKVKSAIEAQLKQTKEQELTNTFIQKLHDAAKIETNV